MSSSPAPSPDFAPSTVQRRARLGVVAAFFACGFAMAGWVVHIPGIMGHTGLDESGLGALLLIMGGTALAAMQLGGSLAARWGSKPVLAWGALLMCLSVAGAAAAPSPLWLGVALAGFGLGNGSVDLAMNEQAVRVEKLYRRPIMGSFHAFYSIGGAIGAAVGGLLLTLGWPAVVTLGLMAGLSLLVALASLPVLVPGRPGAEERTQVEASMLGVDPLEAPDAATVAPAGELTPAAPPEAASSAAQGALGGVSVLRMGIILGAMAFSFFLAEGTVNDWSARHAVEHLHVSVPMAAVAFGVFSTAMTIGRFAADRIAHAFGAVNVVRYGSLLAALGMAVVVFLPSYTATVIGWGLYGLGLSGIVPQLFTAAGSLVSGPRGAVVLARVVGAGYLGLLAGPAIVGWLSHAVGLNDAFILPLALCLLGTALSFSLQRAKR